MKKFTISVQERHVTYYDIEAESAEAALEMFNGVNRWEHFGDGFMEFVEEIADSVEVTPA